MFTDNVFHLFSSKLGIIQLICRHLKGSMSKLFILRVSLNSQISIFGILISVGHGNVVSLKNVLLNTTTIVLSSVC